MLYLTKVADKRVIWLLPPVSSCRKNPTLEWTPWLCPVAQLVSDDQSGTEPLAVASG
jgi:hypothetical protein